MVSIIIPAYNSHQFLRDALLSIQAQSMRDWEVIIWDDGSTPALRDIVDAFSDQRFFYFYDSNSGVSKSRNRGFEKSKGEFVVFFDSDDLMSPDFLQSRVDVLTNSDDFDFVCAHARVINELGEESSEFLIPACENLEEDLMQYEPPHSNKITCPSNYMFRRTVMEDKKFEVQLQSSADRLFLLGLSGIHKGFDLGQKGIVYYRRSLNSMSARKDIHFYLDNYQYFKLVRKKRDRISPANYQQFCFGHGKVLAYGFLENWELLRGLQFLWISIRNNPFYYLDKLFPNQSRHLKQGYEIRD